MRRHLPKVVVVVVLLVFAAWFVMWPEEGIDTPLPPEAVEQQP